MTRVGRFPVFCHGLLGVYFFFEAFIAVDCAEFVVKTIVTKKNNNNNTDLWSLSS